MGNSIKGRRMYNLIPVVSRHFQKTDTRAGAILEKFAEIKGNLPIAVGVQPEVPCQISGQNFS